MVPYFTLMYIFILLIPNVRNLELVNLQEASGIAYSGAGAASPVSPRASCFSCMQDT
jgi:hypothetical protein